MMTSSYAFHQRAMRVAIRFAARNEGLTGSNPAVGALILRMREGKAPLVLACSATAPSGRPHAETLAIEEGLAHIAAPHFSKQDWLYVTLEPCAHYGKTPPCVEAIKKAQIRQVVIALRDPDPRVSGKGIKFLEQAGIKVICDIEGDYALQHLFSYMVNQYYKRPAISLKMAVSLDGAIAPLGIGNYQISNNLSKARTHLLRAQHDAIIIGTTTALLDDPLLTCRLPGLSERSPLRLVIDRALKINPNQRLIESAHKWPCSLIMDQDLANQQEMREKIALLESKKVKIVKLPFMRGKIDLESLLAYLWEQDIRSLLLEGGAALAAAFLEADLVDRLYLFKGQKIIGAKQLFMPSVEKLYPCYKPINKLLYNGDHFEQWHRLLPLAHNKA